MPIFNDDPSRDGVLWNFWKVQVAIGGLLFEGSAAQSEQCPQVLAFSILLISLAPDGGCGPPLVPDPSLGGVGAAPPHVHIDR